MQCTFTVENSQLQLNSLMTFSKVVAVEISLLAFDFVKCAFQTLHLIMFYYFFIDVSPQMLVYFRWL